MVLFRETKAVRDILASAAPTITQNGADRSTSFQIDSGTAGLPYDRLTVSAAPGFFSRAAEVLSSNDAKNWTLIGGGTITRTSNEEKLSISFGEPWTRYLKLTAFNGDSPALGIDNIELSGLRRMIVFPSKKPGPYQLYTGNSSASAPFYDFAVVTPENIDPSPATLGPAVNNPRYHAPSLPWTDRSPIFFNTFLILAVLAMGFVTLRYFMKLRAT